MKNKVFKQIGFDFEIDFERIPVEFFAKTILLLVNYKSSVKTSEIIDVTTVIDCNKIHVTFSGESNNREACERILHDILPIAVNGIYYTIKFLNEIDVIDIPYGYLEEEEVVKDAFAAITRIV